MTTDDVTKRGARVIAARRAAKATQAAKERDNAIRAAHVAGNTIRAIAAVCDLSAARVHQILHKT